MVAQSRRHKLAEVSAFGSRHHRLSTLRFIADIPGLSRRQTTAIWKCIYEGKLQMHLDENLLQVAQKL